MLRAVRTNGGERHLCAFRVSGFLVFRVFCLFLIFLIFSLFSSPLSLIISIFAASHAEFVLWGHSSAG